MKSDGTTTLERFIESLGDACLVLSEDGDIIAANREAEALYGWQRSEIIGRELQDLSSEVELPILDCARNSCDQHARMFVARQRRVDGTTFLGGFSAARHEIAEGSTKLVILVRRLEETLEACEEHLELHQLLLDHALDGILAHSLQGELLYANSAAQQQWGCSFEEMLQRGYWGWIAPESRPRVTSRISRLIEYGEARFETHERDPDGRQSHREVFARLVHTTSGPIVVSTVRDISERVEAEEMVRYLAYHDMLTGLANRVLLDQELAHAISEAERHGDLVGLVFIDLDDFKPINDTFGHLAGDEVLREVANRIAGCVREYDTVARVGGDEFVVVLPRLPQAETLQTVARKLLREVSRPMPAAGGELCVTASLGLALHRAGDDANSMMTRADTEMYQSRERKRVRRGAQAG